MLLVETDLVIQPTIVFDESSEVSNHSRNKGDFVRERTKVSATAFLVVEQIVMHTSAIQASEKVRPRTLDGSQSLKCNAKLFGDGILFNFVQ